MRNFLFLLNLEVIQRIIKAMIKTIHTIVNQQLCFSCKVGWFFHLIDLNKNIIYIQLYLSHRHSFCYVLLFIILKGEFSRKGVYKSNAMVFKWPLFVIISYTLTKVCTWIRVLPTKALCSSCSLIRLLVSIIWVVMSLDLHLLVARKRSDTEINDKLGISFWTLKSLNIIMDFWRVRCYIFVPFYECPSEMASLSTCMEVYSTRSIF